MSQRLTKREWLALCLLPLIVLLFCFAVSKVDKASTNGRPDAEQKQASRYTLKIEKERSFDEALSTDPVALYTERLFWATTFLAIFTVVLAGVTILIWLDAKETSARQRIASRRSLMHAAKSAKAAEDSIAAANRSSEKQLRAYVGIVMAGPIDGSKLNFVFHVRNFGLTPAYDYRLCLAYEYRFVALMDYPTQTIDPDINPRKTLFPGHIDVVTPTININRSEGYAMEPDWQTVLDGRDAIRIFGEIRYRDAFDCERTTFVNLFARGSRAATGFMNAPHGNHST